MPDQQQQPKIAPKPGTVVPWEQKIKELPPMTGREDLVKQQWEAYDAWAYTYLWHLVVSF